MDLRPLPLVVALLLSAGTAVAADEPRNSKPTMTGTAGADRLTGRNTSKRDVIHGLDGDDRISGRAGNDVLLGQSGADVLLGGTGKDIIEGASGKDRLNGGRGRDQLDGGSGPDRIEARDGERDEVFCGSGRDVAIVDRKDRVSGTCETIRRK